MNEIQIEEVSTDPIDTVQIVVIDQQQFDQLHNDYLAINQTATWIFILLAVLLGVHLMAAFWQGWRAAK